MPTRQERDTAARRRRRTTARIIAGAGWTVAVADAVAVVIAAQTRSLDPPAFAALYTFGVLTLLVCTLVALWLDGAR